MRTIRFTVTTDGLGLLCDLPATCFTAGLLTSGLTDRLFCSRFLASRLLASCLLASCLLAGRLLAGRFLASALLARGLLCCRFLRRGFLARRGLAGGFLGGRFLTARLFHCHRFGSLPFREPGPSDDGRFDVVRVVASFIPQTGGFCKRAPTWAACASLSTPPSSTFSMRE